MIYEYFAVNSWLCVGGNIQACFTDDYSHCPGSSHQQEKERCKTSIPVTRRRGVVSRNLPIAQNFENKNKNKQMGPN